MNEELNNRLWDETETNWAIEKGIAQPEPTEVDPNFDPPVMDWVALDSILNRKSIFERIDDLILRIPSTAYSVVGCLWLITLYPILRFLTIRTLDSIYNTDRDNRVFWLLIATSYVLFSAFTISFFLFHLIKQNEGRRKKPIRQNVFSPRYAVLASSILLILVLSLAALGDFFNEVNKVVPTSFGLTYVAADYEAIISDPEKRKEFEEESKSLSIESLSKDKLNALAVAALVDSNKVLAYQALALGNHYFPEQRSPEMEYNRSKLDAPSRYTNEYKSKDLTERDVVKMLDSVKFLNVSELIRETSNESLDNLAIAFVESGYPKKAKSIFESMFEQGKADDLTIRNFYKFVIDHYHINRPDNYRYFVLDDNSVRLVTDVSLDSAYRINQKDFPDFVKSLFKENNVELINYIGVINEETKNYDKAYMAYFIADQKDPFGTVPSIQHNYAKQIESLEFLLGNNQNVGIVKFKNIVRYVNSDCQTAFGEGLADPYFKDNDNCNAVFNERRLDFRRTIKFYTNAMVEDDPLAKINYNNLLKDVNILTAVSNDKD